MKRNYLCFALLLTVSIAPTTADQNGITNIHGSWEFFLASGAMEASVPGELVPAATALELMVRSDGSGTLGRLPIVWRWDETGALIVKSSEETFSFRFFWTPYTDVYIYFLKAEGSVFFGIFRRKQ